MRLIVARHGTVHATPEEKRFIGSMTDPPLCAPGREQAQALGRRLAREGYRFGAAFSGPLRRQHETVRLALAAAGISADILREPALVEIDYGVWEGKSKEELLRTWPEELRAWKKEGKWPAQFVGSFEAAQSALREWLGRTASLPTDEVLAVTSQGTLRALFALLAPETWASLGAEARATDVNVEHGHWCELTVAPDGQSNVIRWNVPPGSP